MWKQQQSIASTGGSSRFFYNLLQLPRSNQYRLEMLHWVGARLWLAQILMSWGAVATCMAFTSSAWSFYLLRFRFGGGLYAGRSLPHLLVPLALSRPSDCGLSLALFRQFSAARSDNHNDLHTRIRGSLWSAMDVYRRGHTDDSAGSVDFVLSHRPSDRGGAADAGAARMVAVGAPGRP
jgi:hypothetical protein